MLQVEEATPSLQAEEAILTLILIPIPMAAVVDPVTRGIRILPRLRRPTQTRKSRL